MEEGGQERICYESKRAEKRDSVVVGRERERKDSESEEEKNE